MQNISEIEDLVKLISEVMCKNIEIKSSEKRIRPESSEVERLMCDNSKLLENTSWNPEFNLSKGIQVVVNWMQNPENLSIYKSDEYNV